MEVLSGPERLQEKETPRIFSRTVYRPEPIEKRIYTSLGGRREYSPSSWRTMVVSRGGMS